MSDSKTLSKDSVESCQAAVAEFQSSKEYPIIDEPQALAVCNDDWSFLLELLNDVLGQNRISDVQRMETGVKNKDYHEYYQGAHSLKGVCMNLHLPALVAVCKAAEMAGKLLHHFPDVNNSSELLANLDPYITRIQKEFQRLEDFLPTLQVKAQQAEGEGEGEEYEDEGEGEEQEDDQQEEPQT